MAPEANTASLHQDVTLPQGWAYAVLSLQLRVLGWNDDDLVHDTLVVELQDDTGASLAVLGNFSNLDMGTVSPKAGGKWHWHQKWDAPCYSGSFNTATGLTFVGHLGKGDAKNGLGDRKSVV